MAAILLFSSLLGCALSAATLAAEGHASPDPPAVCVQLDYVQASWAPLIQRAPFARFPLFTLLADGTVVYLAPRSAPGPDSYLTARLTPVETEGIRAHVLDLGFASLQTDTTFSSRSPNPPDVISTRGADSIISMRMEDGTLRTVRNNGFFANYPDTLKAIFAFLSSWASPNAVPYKPSTATVAVDSRWKPAGDERPAYPAWPLSESLLRASPTAENPSGVPFVIDRAEYAALMRAGEAWLRGRMYFSQGEHAYLVVVRPWLPGEDFAAAIESFGSN